MNSTKPCIDDIVSVAEEAATQAGSIQRDSFTAPVNVEYKGPGDIVTEIDKESERVIRKRIESSYPNHEIFGEETGLSGKSNYRWVIDPLDGTTNFYHNIPHFGVSIAFEVDGKPIVSVIYLTPKDDLYIATETGRSEKNGQTVTTSNIDTLEESLLATGFPHGVSNEAQVAAFKAAQDISHGVRRFGSAAEDFGLVAQGNFDAYFHASLPPWDRDAGCLLVEAAGGETTVVETSTQDHHAHVVASGPEIHDELCNLIFDYFEIPNK